MPPPEEGAMPRQRGLTWNRDVSFELPPLGVSEEKHHAFPIVAAEDAEVLADAFLSSTFRFGLGHPADEYQLGAK
jgi:hypothetical protein